MRHAVHGHPSLRTSADSVTLGSEIPSLTSGSPDSAGRSLPNCGKSATTLVKPSHWAPQKSCTVARNFEVKSVDGEDGAFSTGILLNTPGCLVKHREWENKSL